MLAQPSSVPQYALRPSGAFASQGLSFAVKSLKLLRMLLEGNPTDAGSPTPPSLLLLLAVALAKLKAELLPEELAFELPLPSLLEELALELLLLLVLELPSLPLPPPPPLLSWSSWDDLKHICP